MKTKGLQSRRQKYFSLASIHFLVRLLLGKFKRFALLEQRHQTSILCYPQIIYLESIIYIHLLSVPMLSPNLFLFLKENSMGFLFENRLVLAYLASIDFYLRNKFNKYLSVLTSYVTCDVRLQHCFQHIVLLTSYIQI